MLEDAPSQRTAEGQTRPARSGLRRWMADNRWGLSIALAGLALRLVRMSPVWNSSDAADLPLAIDGLVCRPGSLAHDLWALASYRLGGVEPVLVYLTMRLFRLFHVQVLEPEWEIATLLAGTLAVFLSFLVGKRVAGAGAGIMAALLIALCPMAIIQSRHAGAPWMYEQCFQFALLLLVLKLHERPSARTRLAFHATLALDVWSGNQMMGIAPVLAYGALAGAVTRPRDESAVGYLWRRYGGPSALLPIASFSFLLHAAFEWKQGHLAHALFDKRHKLGFYLDHWLDDMKYNVGPVVTWLGLFVLVVGTVLERPLLSIKRLPSVLFVSYAFPFWFLLPPGSTLTRGYITYGLSALLLVLATVPFRWPLPAPLRPVLPSIAALILAVGVGQAAYHLYRLDAFAARGFQGSYTGNNGAKAAAQWIRRRSSGRVRVFSDATGGTGLEPSVVSMYFRKPVFGLMDGRGTQPYDVYRKRANQIEYLLVAPPNRRRVRRYFGDTFKEALRVTEHGEEELLVYARNPGPSVETIDVTDGDREFAARYSLLCAD